VNKKLDDDLMRERFLSLKAEDEARAPDFQAMMEQLRLGAGEADRLRVSGQEVVDQAVRPSRRRRLLWASGWASTALAAAVAGLLLMGLESEDAEFERLVSSYSSDAAAGAWRSPTSRLLAVPGIELIRSVPSVGRSLGGAALDPSTNIPPSDGTESLL
jgi:hypothetical protein